MFAKYDRDAYNLGNDFLRKKEDGTRYTIDDLIKDKNVTDPKIIEQMKEDYKSGRENFFWCHSCIS
jgi:hypothetical protein